MAPPTSGGVLDTLKKADEQQKQAPGGARRRRGRNKAGWLCGRRLLPSASAIPINALK